MGGGAFCVCRIPRKDGLAPQARRVRGFNPAGSARFYARALWARGGFYRKRYFIKSSSRPANAVGALATGFNPAGQPAFMRRHMAAGGSLWEAPLYQEKFARQDSGF